MDRRKILKVTDLLLSTEVTAELVNSVRKAEKQKKVSFYL